MLLHLIPMSYFPRISALGLRLLKNLSDKYGICLAWSLLSMIWALASLLWDSPSWSMTVRWREICHRFLLFHGRYSSPSQLWNCWVWVVCSLVPRGFLLSHRCMVLVLDGVAGGTFCHFPQCLDSLSILFMWAIIARSEIWSGVQLNIERYL